MKQIDKDLLIKKILDKKNQTQTKPQTLVEEHEYVDVSPNQRRLLIIDSLKDSVVTYNIYSAFKLEGKLNYKILEETWNYLLKRHSTLRTVFKQQEGQYFQKIVEHKYINIPVEPFTSEKFAFDKLVRDSQIHFNLSTGPLTNIKLYKYGDQRHLLLLNIHHIVSDHWSLNIIIEEFITAYKTFWVGEQPNLDPLPIQFIDLCKRNNIGYDRMKYKAQIEFWKNKLQDVPEQMNLPFDKERSALQTNDGTAFNFEISNHLTSKVNEFCKINEVTPYMFFLAVFNILLYRFTGMNKIILGTPASNRKNMDEEKLVGFFVNTIILYSLVDEKEDFYKLLKSVKKNLLSAYTNSDIAFDQLVQELNPKRSLSYDPFVQVEFLLLNNKNLSFNFNIADLSVKKLEVPVMGIKYDLSLCVFNNVNSYNFIIEYNTDLFVKETIQYMADCYAHLINSVLTEPTHKIYKQKLFPDKEYNKLFLDWSSGKNQFKNDINFIDLFNSQVAQAPNKIAVDDGIETIDYKTLAQRSDQLADILQANGISKSSHIALYINRNNNYLISLLACIKIAAVFIPFNPQRTYEQNKLSLNSSNSKIILVDSNSLQSLNNTVLDHQLICIDDITWDPNFNKIVTVDIACDDIVYMLYTSGSTGLPKGALVKHRGFINHLRAKVVDLKLTSHDCVAQTAIQTFDISIWQFLVALIIGAKTQVFVGDTAWQPNLLLDTVIEKGVTILESVPSHLDIILDKIVENSSVSKLKKLRMIISTGENLSIKLCNKLMSHLPEITVVNAYGPTECSDDVTHCCIESMKELNKFDFIPLGNPIANTNIYVLDKYMQPVPIRVAGEIYISGECLGAGYYEDPERTKKAFLTDFGDSKAFTNLYRTGDIARYNYKGQLEYLGRSDTQIKIRGMRVDFANIETVISLDKNVRKCIVTFLPNNTANLQLIAFIMCNTRPAPSANYFKNYCVKILPDYMVPSYIVIVDEFDLLENGKIDIHKLPFPKPAEFITTKYIAARNDIESTLVTIWQNVLKVKKIGIDDDFFQLGGHSLLLMTLIGKINSTFKVNTTPKMLFDNSTIRQLASILKQLQEKSSDDD